MKTKKNNTKKIIAAILAFVLIGVILYFANGMVGNPLSKMLANRSAEKYVTEKYSDLDLEIQKAVYNFKDGRYYVEASSPTSIDTHFALQYSWAGKLEYDEYEDLVVSKWNTFQRIDDEYRKLVDSKIESQMDFNEREYMFGGLTEEDDFSNLEIDKKYDVKELAKTQGHINLSIENDILDAGIISEELMMIKEKFDSEDIPFNDIDIDLNPPRKEDASEEELLAQEYLMIKDFPYSDIYPDGLEERVKENIEETKRYYEEQDKETQELIEDLEEDNN